MANDQKQFDLEKYYALVLATLAYLEQNLGQSIIYDDINPVMEYYHDQKIQTEKNFKQRKLDRLQKRFASLIKGLRNSIDLKFSSYLKEKTGYDIDIFQDLRNRLEVIFTQDDILNEENLNDACIALELFNQTSTEEEKVRRIRALLTKYNQGQAKSKNNSKTSVKSVVTKIDDETERLTVTHTVGGSKWKHFEEQVQVSPDGKRRVRSVQWASKDNSGTYVSVDFPTASGPVYGTIGIHTIVKAWWKDNFTIVIETGKDIEANTQYKKVRSFNDVITIEYVLH